MFFFPKYKANQTKLNIFINKKQNKNIKNEKSISIFFTRNRTYLMFPSHIQLTNFYGSNFYPN